MAKTLITAIVVFALAASLPAKAQTPLTSIDQLAGIHQKARQAQQTIDALDQQQQLLQQQITLIENEGNSYALQNLELEQTINQLRRTADTLQVDLNAISETQTGIIDLLQAMVNSLERFIELDLPFKKEQRLQRVGLIRKQLNTDTSYASLYQNIVSAYLDEILYGQSDEVFTQTINLKHRALRVEVLRLGRTGLWYRTPDGTNAGRWDPVRAQWVDDGLTDAAEVAKAIAILLQQTTPVWIELPVVLKPR